MSDDIEQLNVALEDLEAAENNPMMILKAAFSRLPVILLIGSGIILNWLLALVFLVGNITTAPFVTILITLVILVAVFPACYFYAAYMYGQEAVVYDVYSKMIRPILGNLIARILNKVLKDGATTTDASIEEEIKKEGGSFLDKIPEFIKSRLTIFTVINDVIKLATQHHKNGGSKETAKNNIVAYVFELLDARMETIANPSLKPFFIIAGLNFIAFLFI